VKKPASENNHDIFVISLGCPRNLVDSEVLTGSLKQKGFRVLHEFKACSAAIVNTCGFIEDAKEESIDAILELAELKKKGRLERLIVTGCLSQRYGKHLMKEVEGIDAVFGSGNFREIPEYIGRILNGEKISSVDRVPNFLYDHRMPRSVMTPRHSVYVKIQEGCMNLCSYCVIPQIKGPYRSRAAESVLDEIRALKKSGAKEINLIGQDTTLYGAERYKRPALAGLIKKASRIMKSGWIRLLYTHPAHYDEELIGALRDEEPLCKYLDLPIQHISDKILKRMNRRVTKKDITALIEKLRKVIPGLAIRTSVMVGFPGETDRDFNELEAFIKEIKFERLGAFIYSREEGTVAFDFSNHVPEKEKEQRFARVMEAQKKVSAEKNQTYLGRTMKVLIDERDESGPGQYLGRTEYDAPEVDGGVYVKSKKALKPGDFVNARIEGVMEYDLAGSA